VKTINLQLVAEAIVAVDHHTLEEHRVALLYLRDFQWI
jgi:hypothetical protein